MDVCYICYSYWIALGSQYSNSDGSSTTDTGFTGCISQFNIYSRILDFVTEIPEMYKLRNLTGDLLQWAEFTLHGNTIRTHFSLEDSAPQGKYEPAVNSLFYKNSQFCF